MKAVRTMTVTDQSQTPEEAKVTARVTRDEFSLGTNDAFAITPEPTRALGTKEHKEMNIVDDDQLKDENGEANPSGHIPTGSDYSNQRGKMEPIGQELVIEDGGVV